MQRAGGVDALQALLLAVEGARIALEKAGSRFSWLDIDPDKAGSGIPRYIPIHFGPQYEARINMAIERENKRYFEDRLKTRTSNIKAFEAEVKARREVLSILEAALERRKARAAEWTTELKTWKREKTRGMLL